MHHTENEVVSIQNEAFNHDVRVSQWNLGNASPNKASIVNIQDDGNNTLDKKLEDFTLSELLQIKEDVEEYYGKGVLQSCILKDVTKVFGIPKMNLDRGRNVSTVLEGLEPVPWKQRSLLEALLNQQSKEKKWVNGEDEVIPLKPLT